MNTVRQNQTTLWRTIAGGLTEGLSVVQSLDRARTKLAGTPLDPVILSLVQSVRGEERLSEAMERHASAFPHAVRIMVRAGEAGRVLDQVTGRIASAIADESFALPGAAACATPEPARYWRALGWLLSSGVPILEAFTILAEQSEDKRLAEASETIRKAILDGESIADAIRPLSDVFPAEVCAAVDAAEKAGELDYACVRIADAIKSGDLSALGTGSTTAAAPTAEESQVVRTLNGILLEAFKTGASDVHIDPTESGGRVRLRVDGSLRDLEPLSAKLVAAVVSRIKIMSNMDIAERRLPQDGRIMVEISGRKLDLRVCVVPTVSGERVVMRLLVREFPQFRLEQLGLSGADLTTVRRLADTPHGIIIASGPAGSGKTTLLYSMLSALDRDKLCVMSVEDPVECRIEGVAQMETRAQFGLTIPRALRAVLRQDLDVVMVAEMRDLETLEAVVQTAVTGHLVLTTLHTNTSPSALRRLVEVGLEPFRVNAAVAAVISVRLVRKLCEKCRRAADPPVHSMPPEAVEFVRNAKGATFYAAAGCDACSGTGYRGRTGIFEILVMDENVRKAVASSADAGALRAAAIASGMKPMLIDGLEKAALGITSIEEVCRCTVGFGSA